MKYKLEQSDIYAFAARLRVRLAIILFQVRM